MALEQLQDYGLEEMDEVSIHEFLRSQSTGVLGLPTKNAPYMLPMSYAYDGDSSLYFTYLLGESSRKETLSDLAERARFLVYNVETMFNWQSVILTGDLEEVPQEEWPDLEDVLTNAWQPELFQTAGASGRIKVYKLSIRSQTGIRHTGLALGFQEGIEEPDEATEST